ncbi:hypothetical protein LCGC14_3156840, partial [marine sediment metagenome]
MKINFTVDFEFDYKTGEIRLKPPTNERHRTNNNWTYTPEKTLRDRERIMFAAREAVYRQPDFKVMTGAVRFNLIAFFTPPSSWSKKKRLAALMNEIYPIVVPDYDNIAKIVTDALGMKRKKGNRP